MLEILSSSEKRFDTELVSPNAEQKLSSSASKFVNYKIIIINSTFE